MTKFFRHYFQSTNSPFGDFTNTSWVLQNSILDSIKLIKQKPQLSQAEAFLCPQSFVTLWQSIKKLHKVNV